MSPVYDRLIELLDTAAVPYSVSRHEPVFTSEEAARVRGTELSSGAKALICKADDRFLMIVLPADRRLASRKVRHGLGIRSLRFAAAEEVWELTGLKPGSIPPFGSLFQLATYCDCGLQQQPRINFNAGDHSISISMASQDFELAEHPGYGDFAD